VEALNLRDVIIDAAYPDWQRALATGESFSQRLTLRGAGAPAGCLLLEIEADRVDESIASQIANPCFLLRCKGHWENEGGRDEADEEQAALSEMIGILNAAVEMSQVGGWSYEVATGRMLWTDYTYVICHLDPSVDEPSMERVFSLVAEKDRPALNQAVEKAIADGTPYEMELTVCLAGEDDRIMRTICRPLIEDGTVTHLVGALQDLTEQKAIEQTLRQQADLLNQTQRIAKLGGWELDLATGLTTWTDEVYRIHEVDRSFDHNLDNGIEFYSPEDQLRLQAALEEARLQRQEFDIECRFITARGTQRWVRILGAPLFHGEEITHISGLIHDITQQKEAELALLERETRLHRLTQNVPGVIYEFEVKPDGSQIFPFLSEGIESIFPGVDPEALKQDATLSYDLLHPEDKALVLAEGDRSLQTLSENHAEFRILHEGETYWRQAIAKPERKPDGSTVWYGLFRDITAEKRTQQALERTTRHLLNAQRTARIGSYEIDLAHGLMHLSDMLGEFLGFSAQAMISLDEFFSLIHPDDLGRVLEVYEHAIEQGLDFHLEYRLKRPDGKLIHVHSWGYCERDGQGRVARVFGTKQDITERKKAELALADNEEKLRLLTENMREAFWLRSSDNLEVKYISPAYEQVWGMSCESLYQAPNSFIEAIHPEDRARVISALNAYPDTQNYDMEHRLLGPNGRVRWVWVRQSPVLDANGAVIAHTGIAADITDRMRSEELLRLLESVVEHGQDAVLITGAEPSQGSRIKSTIVYVNPAFCRMTGYTPEEVIGRTPDLLHGEKTDPKEVARIAHAVANWEAYETELINYRKDGSEYWSNFVITPIADENGICTHWVSIQRDTTRRKKEEAELMAAKEQAERASQAKSEFLSTMSHEIRTPLNAIIGMTGLLSETDLDNEQASCLRTIRQGGESLLSVINDILDYSKIESGQMELEVESFELLDPIEDALELLADKAHRKRLELLYQPIEPLPHLVKGDVTRLRQVLVNLVGNAIKFTEKGEILVSVQILEKTDEDITLQFAVKDTGIGIPAEKLDRLFKSFSQVDASTTRKFGGTGLGLAISQKLVELHGGRIWVETEWGQGATFFFTLKVQRDQAAQGARSHPVSLQAKKIWLVDDNETNLLIQRKLLEAQGVEVSVFSQPAMLQQHWDRFPAPDLLVIDFHMPDMDGQGLGRWIRERNAEIPLMLLSSGQSGKQYREIFDLVMQKPMRNREFVQAVSRLLNREPAQEANLRQVKIDKAELARFQVLLVEDNKVNQRVAQRMLAKFGLKVETANNGQEAVDFVRLRSFDLVLMDMQMPVMDGLEATRVIRSIPDHPQPIILAMTANASKEDRSLCLAAGMDDFISKPIKLNDLREYLRRWLLKEE